MKIVLGPASTQLAETLAELTGAERIPVVFKTFPDGESYVRLEGTIQDENVVVVQTMGPPQDTRLIQTALMVDAAKRNGAKNVTIVVPYLAYARQDRAFLPGEPVSIEAVGHMLRVVGVDGLITVNVQQEKVFTKLPFSAKNVSAVGSLAEYFKHRGFERTFALAPDAGALHIVEEAKEVLGGECGFLEKHRDRYTGQISVGKKALDVKGKPAIIFDDIISTGGTIVAAAKILYESGAKEVHVACVHALLIGDAEKRIREAGVKEIVATDSVPSAVSKVSLAPLISKELKAQ